jgi:hypothetical protein
MLQLLHLAVLRIMANTKLCVARYIDPTSSNFLETMPGMLAGFE